MSRDSTATYVHTQASHHADLFEEFCHPPSSNAQSTSSGAMNNVGANMNGSSEPGMVQIPGHFLPFEEIQLPPHLMPVNPEDEDDVVPDMHAAFGIQRALGGQQAAGIPGQSGEGSGRGAQQEPIWRDLGLDALLDGTTISKSKNGTVTDAKGEGKKTGLLLMR